VPAKKSTPQKRVAPRDVEKREQNLPIGPEEAAAIAEKRAAALAEPAVEVQSDFTVRFDTLSCTIDRNAMGKEEIRCMVRAHAVVTRPEAKATSTDVLFEVAIPAEVVKRDAD